MKSIKIDCTFEERKSEKTNKNYQALFIKLANDYEKVVFLTVPEVKLLESTYKEDSNTTNWSTFE